MVQDSGYKAVGAWKVLKVAAAILLLPVLILTYYWWGFKYYASVIG